VNRLPFTVKELCLCIISAILLILSFPNFNLWLCAWFGFVPLFFALKNKSKGQAFLFSYLTGVIFWLGIIYWLVHVTLVGLVVLVLYLALYFGLFGLIVSTYLLPTTYYLLFIPSIWVLLEYIHSHLFTGFPWALLGYSQYLNIPVIQIADISGVWGISFLVMLVNVFIYSLVSKKGRFKLASKFFLLPFFILVSSLVYGYYKLNLTPTYYLLPTKIKISVVQPNIPQELKWNPQSNNYIMNKYLDISLRAVKDNPDLIIWPEAALPVVLEEVPSYYERVKDFVREIKTPLLFGAVTKRDNLYYNSALLVSQEARLLSRYDKLHLVPFGEYIPLRKVFGFLETIVPIGDFTPGKEYTILELASEPVSQLASYNRQTGKPANRQTKFSVLICFEDLFPELSRNFVKKGANFLVNITNDAWFKKTSSPYQHLCASVFRAVENRVVVVRAANTGVSGFIVPTGKIVSLVSDKSGENIFVSGYKTQEISVSKQSPSFYNRYGDIFIVFCVLSILGSISTFKKKP
jgi:apolipoprotein N-acyltransferase